MAAFVSQEITVRSYDGAVLSGVLEIPRDRELKALAIPVHGSFPQTRDGNIDNTRTWMFPTPVPERNLFIDFRDTVISLGVGTLRYDKRASGSSEGILDFGAEPSFLISQGGGLESFELLLDLQRDRAAERFLDDPDGLTAREFPGLSDPRCNWSGLTR